MMAFRTAIRNVASEPGAWCRHIVRTLRLCALRPSRLRCSAIRRRSGHPRVTGGRAAPCQRRSLDPVRGRRNARSRCIQALREDGRVADQDRSQSPPFQHLHSDIVETPRIRIPALFSPDPLVGTTRSIHFYINCREQRLVNHCNCWLQTTPPNPDRTCGVSRDVRFSPLALRLACKTSQPLEKEKL